MRTRNLTTDHQLALYVGVTTADIAKLRAGAPVSPKLALRVATLQGDRHYLGAWFDQVQNENAA